MKHSPLALIGEGIFANSGFSPSTYQWLARMPTGPDRLRPQHFRFSWWPSDADVCNFPPIKRAKMRAGSPDTL